MDCWFFLLAINATAFRLSIIGQIWSTLFVNDPQGMYLQFVRKLFMLKYEILNEFLVYIFKVQIFFSNFRTISATTTKISFNGEIRQRTSNTWRREQLCLSSQDLLNDMFQQELHHILIGQRTLSSKRKICGNSHTRHNIRMHHRR